MKRTNRKKKSEANILEKHYVLFTSVFILIVSSCLFAQFTQQSLQSTIDRVQPMTGIVLWTTNSQNNTDAVQLEFSYMLYNDIVTDSGVYDWSIVDDLLDEVQSRGHQAILRYRFVYPGYQTSVPDYIKSLPDYNETEGVTEGMQTWFPDWTHPELMRFTLRFYSAFAQRYDNDPRLAFAQTGFGLWAEYHIYDGPFILGETFPSKEFQADFITHLDSIFQKTHWSISKDAAQDTYSPFADDQTLVNMRFGIFDDSFMCEEHSEWNAPKWEFFGLDRFMSSPAGGELSYYTEYDQQHALDSTGMYGITFEQAAEDFHISYMIGNDQPEYHTMGRIKEASMACGYRFAVTSFLVSDDSSIVTVKNNGVAPIYYDAFPAVNGIRSDVSLKNLVPGDSVECGAGSGGESPVLTIECDRLIQTRQIQYEADLSGASPVRTGRINLIKLQKAEDITVYTLNGREINKADFLKRSRTSGKAKGLYICDYGNGKKTKNVLMPGAGNNVFDEE